jgi:hypothetical protein
MRYFSIMAAIPRRSSGTIRADLPASGVAQVDTESGKKFSCPKTKALRRACRGVETDSLLVSRRIGVWALSDEISRGLRSRRRKKETERKKTYKEAQSPSSATSDMNFLFLKLSDKKMNQNEFIVKGYFMRNNKRRFTDC